MTLRRTDIRIPDLSKTKQLEFCLQMGRLNPEDQWSPLCDAMNIARSTGSSWANKFEHFIAVLRGKDVLKCCAVGVVNCVGMFC